MKQDKSHRLATTLVLCVIGLYGSFLTWSILQERINTKPYGNEGNPQYFKAPLMINIAQSLFSIIISYIYCQVTTKTNPLGVFLENDKKISKYFLVKFVMISITSSLSAPLGYKALNHVDYLVYLLAKSCKLIPIMLVHFIMYNTKFPLYKYGVALAVTAGVALFTVSNSKKKGSNNDGNTGLGLVQLLGSMLLDGLTNSTQDQMFKFQNSISPQTKLFKITGTSLMCNLNLFMLIMTLGYVGIFKSQEFSYTLNFIRQYPQVLSDIITFASFGAIGQIFVFIILETFDSVVLTTATVTRKMLSMVLSVVFFGHSLLLTQWLGIGFVFVGIGYEAMVKVSPKRSINSKKME